MNSIIAEFDPDSPKHEHFCVPETEKYPFSQNGSAVLLRELVISKKKKAPSEAFQSSKEKEAIKKVKMFLIFYLMTLKITRSDNFFTGLRGPARSEKSCHFLLLFEKFIKNGAFFCFYGKF